MVQVTRDDIARAQEAIREIDAAPSEPGTEPRVTSSTDTAQEIIARTIAEAREDATPDATDPSDELDAVKAELEQAKAAIEGMLLKVRIFNHTAAGLTAMLNVHAQEIQAAQAAQAAQDDVVEAVADEAASE
jgi:ketopantoate reductase